MADKKLHDAFIDQLRDIYDAEKQTLKVLRKLGKAASSPELRKTFETHLEETQGQVSRLERVFSSFDEKVRGKRCDGIAGLIDEAKSVMDDDFDKPTMDACLIAAAQRMEHYEIAAYGTLVVWARSLDKDDVADLLEETLDEERATDELLSTIAMHDVNQDAADGGDADDEDDEDGGEDDEAESDKTDKSRSASGKSEKGSGKAETSKQKTRRRR
jgi:ferritin-like metal-binding protein YciE